MLSHVLEAATNQAEFGEPPNENTFTIYLCKWPFTVPIRKHGIHAGSGTAEADVLQPARMHELDALAKFTLLKTIGVGQPEFLIQNTHGCRRYLAVQSVRRCRNAPT